MIKRLIAVLFCAACLSLAQSVLAQDRSQKPQGTEKNGIYPARYSVEWHDFERRTINLRTEDDSLYSFNSNGFPSFLSIVSWLKKQEYWIRFEENTEPDWGITIAGETVWAKDHGNEELDVDIDGMFGLGRIVLHYPRLKKTSIYSEPSEESFLLESNLSYAYESINDTVIIGSAYAAGDEAYLAYAVVDIVGEWYQIEYNSHEGNLCWVKESDAFVYEPLIDYFKYFTLISWGNEPEVHVKPSGNSETCNENEFTECIYEVIDVNGDWIKLETNLAYPTPTSSGWVRWRKGLKVLIHVYWSM